jgi:hypothetical protein
MSHFSAVGLDVADEAGFNRTVGGLFPLARDDSPSGATTRHRLWRDPSGAALAFHLGEDDAIECVTPFFFAPEPASWRVETSGPADDESCPHCGGADCNLLGADGQMVTRAAVQWLRYMPDRSRMPCTIDLDVVTFAHALSFFPDQKSFEAGQEAIWPTKPGEKPMRMADESFFPTGMFGPNGRIKRAGANSCTRA